MTFMAGNSLLNAIADLEKAVSEAGTRSYAGLVKAGKPTRYEGAHKNDVPKGLDKQTGQGYAQVRECHNIQMAEVEVNTETGETRVLKMTVAVDAWTILNPQSFEGQLEGGKDQGSAMRFARSTSSAGRPTMTISPHWKGGAAASRPYIWTTPARRWSPGRSSQPSTNIIRTIPPAAAGEVTTGLPKS
jgi:hypothetical protein